MNISRLPAVSLLLFAMGCAPGFTLAASQDYTVGDPPLGSSIRRSLRTDARLPVNKTFEQLTPADRQALNDIYEPMAAGDEPPFPLRGMKPLYAAFAELQRKFSDRSDLELVATVNSDGRVTQVHAFGDADPELTRLAGTVVFLTRFKPARCNGEPCRMDFPVHTRFVVKP